MTTNGHKSRLDMWRQQYRQSLKSSDTEEHIDLGFYRPIGFFVAKASSVLGVSPNFLTILSLMLGIVAGVLFYPTSTAVNICGIALLVCANVLDSADGQLARITHQYSRLGRILDGMAGDFWFLAIYISFCLREAHTSAFFQQHQWCIWAMAVAAGLCHIKQAQAADYYRQFHLSSLTADSLAELEDLHALGRRYRAMSWRRNFWSKLGMKGYLTYSMQQAAFTPAMQQLLCTIHARHPAGKVPVSFRRALRRMSLPLMKYTNILTFNWRSFVLFAAVLIGMPWVYFAVELTVFNALLLHMRSRHESMCRLLDKQLKQGDFDA